jgi:hypothetical protein
MAKEKLLGHEKGGGRREGHIMVVRGRVTQPAFAKRGHLIWNFDNAVYMFVAGAAGCQKEYIVWLPSFTPFFFFCSVALGPSALMTLILDFMVCIMEFGCLTWLWIPFESLSNMALGW